jgi:Glycosyl transferase family 11
MDRNGARIVVQIAGGLGNQLFQYAAGRALANRLGARLFLDCTPRALTPMYALDRFPIDAEIIRDAPQRIRPRRFRFGGKLGGRITDICHDVIPKRVTIHGHRFKIFYEKQFFSFDQRFDRLYGSIYLTGWRQSYKYFERASDIVRSELRPNCRPSEANGRWLDQIRREDSVCIHVRRGDYLDPCVLARLGLCMPSYYARAIEIVRERLNNPRFFVFSNDLAWCRDHLPAENLQFVDANSPDDATDELQLMASCRHHIIANSSFSWWAAWLATRPDQIVVAPDPWFVNEPAHDLIPKAWIRLPRD